MPTASQAAHNARGRRLAVLRRAREPLSRTWAIVDRAAAWVMALPVWAVLVTLVLAQWIVVGAVAAINQHNGFFFYNGGDDTWYYTSGWVLSHGHIPDGSVGFGYPFLLAPIAHFAGPNLLRGLPFVIGLNLLILWPIAVCCIYGMAKMIAGRGYAYLTTLVWTVLPVAAIPFFYQRYHFRYIDIVLAPSLGLTALADFPGMVCLLVAGYFGLKAVTLRQAPDAVFVGLAAGLAIAMKPSNAIFLPAPYAALVVARYGRGLLALTAGLVPALLALVLWKYRGLGYLPIIEHASAAVALGRFPAVPLGGLDIHHYVPLNWGQLQNNINYVREFCWSLRLLTWIMVAGVIGLARRSGAGAILMLTWLGSYVILKGSSPVVSVKAGSFFRYLAPAFPAFFMFGASIPLLVPIWGRQRAAAGSATTPWPATRAGWTPLIRIGAVIAAIPIVALIVFRPLTTPKAALVPAFDQYVPANTFALSLNVEPNGIVRLSWPKQRSDGARVRYIVFRMPDDATPPNGLTCTPRAHAASSCVFYSDSLNSVVVPTAETFATSLLDYPPAGHWIYRVALRASESRHTSSGDFMMLSTGRSVYIPE